MKRWPVSSDARPPASDSGLPDLMRRIDRKLDIQRGMALTYDDLALLVTSGAYATLQNANLRYLERQCQEHVARSRSISEANTPFTPGQDAFTKSSGTTPHESASEALARAQAPRDRADCCRPPLPLDIRRWGNLPDMRPGH